MNICKYYVSGKCTNENCRFEHLDNICKNHFFSECTKEKCKYNHSYKYFAKNYNNNNNKNYNNKNNKNNNLVRIRNTETFSPSHNEPSVRIRFNQPIVNANEISIINNMFYEKNLYNKLISEISNDVYKPWHGDTHLIADDSYIEDWKSNSETFNNIIKQLCSYFCMTPGATRLNYYADSNDWKPYHHDAAALKPHKAKTQNITVGISLGKTREISFQSTHKDKSERLTFNFPLQDSTVYSFGNKINIDFRHGIPQLKEETNEGRISIIIWGYSNLL